MKRDYVFPLAKLTAAQVREIRAMPLARGLFTQLAAEYGVSHQVIRTAYLRSTYRHVQDEEPAISWNAIKKALVPMRKVITHYNPKPIPDRNHDWEAVRDDWDLGQPIGYGRTEAEAISDLLMGEDDR